MVVRKGTARQLLDRIECSILKYCATICAAFWLFVPMTAMCAQWLNQVLDEGTGYGGATGFFTSISVINNQPAIAYYDATKRRLMFARAQDSNGSSWGTSLALDNLDGLGDVGKYPSLADVNGYPAISYFDVTNGNLKFIRAINADGTAWAAPIVLDSGGIVGEYTSLAMVNGFPAIAYHDKTNLDLKYIIAQDSDGTVWNAPLTVDSSQTTGEMTSLAVVNGRPAIAYYKASGVDLRYVRAADSLGTAWGAPLSLDSASYSGKYASLCVVNGNPAISYQYTVGEDVMYIRANDINGTTWSSPLIVTYTTESGYYTTLRVVNGNPAISYYDGALMFVRSSNANGTAWNSPKTLDSSYYFTGEYASMTIVNGNPAVAYNYRYWQDLRYKRANDLDGTSWESAHTVDYGNANVGWHACLSIIGGHPAIAYYDDSDGDLRFIRALDCLGLSWGKSQKLADGTIYSGQYPSLMSINGNPAIAYHDESYGHLVYMRSDDSLGDSWSSSVIVDSVGQSGSYASMAVINGNPAVSYYAELTGNLKYARALDVDGTSWSTPIVVRATDRVGLYTSMEYLTGSPVISYYDATNEDLMFVRAADTDGTTWSLPIAVDTANSVGQYTSLEIVNGKPAIAYYDATNGNLKFVRSTNTRGTAWGEPVIVDGVGTIGKYSSLAIINGLPAIAYGDDDNGYPKYVCALDSDGTTWGAPVSVDTVSDSAHSLSLTSVNGAPAMSYCDSAKGNLKYTVLISDPDPLNNASLVSHTIPSEIPKSYPIPISITLHNSGQSIWRCEGGYSLTVADDPCNLAELDALPVDPDDMVMPGENYTFTGTLRGPYSSSGESCSISFRMKEANTLFGDIITAVLTPVDPINDALFSNNTVPLTMFVDQSLWVEFSVRNLGNTTWIQESLFALILTQDSCGMFQQSPQMIGTGFPHSGVQFIAFITAPSIPGPCSIELQMVDWYGEGLFGPVLNKNIDVVIPPNATHDWNIYE